MIKEMTYYATAKNKSAKYIFLGLFGTAMILVLAANLTEKYSGIIWVVALAFITATIYVYNRNVASEYSYSVTDGYRPSFTVGMRIGKTAKVMARVDLSSVFEVKKLTRAEYRAHKCERGVIKYPYFPTMFAETVYLISVRSEHENADIIIEADDEFIEGLKESLEFV